MLNIQLKKEPSTESSELDPGVAVDYNTKDEIVGTEIEDASKFDMSKVSFEILKKMI